ncbi:mitochondrial fission ELM1 family protein [Limibaculum sp. FT325]|uniref:mitochondrial fission ELM1 family protein n=1 Tax=Thermohalobaculum sediminis TaxID=2939436 RepID=UPI0020BFEB59|nr:mitochondrial fission ELM1 family protein [Limibaculum sediminis]MCL5778445.1 mitochondrial fission ELM1 family protein [Limibaculum sediminis]
MESSRTEPGILAIWAMTDGRAGNVAQALGLAEAVARCSPASVTAQEIRPSTVAAALPARIWHALRWLPGWPEGGLARGCPPPGPPWPDLAIGAGRRAAPFVAALGRRHGVRTVQILDPQMDPAAFDLIVAPEHDRLAAPNAIATLGAVGRITPDRVAEAAARLAPRIAHLPPRRVAVLIGGSGNAARWSEDDADRLVAQLAALVAGGTSLLVTTSRRTDPAVVTALRADLDPTQTFLHTGEGENPYPGMLGLAQAVIVTEDSVNMASEAASTGLPVHVFRVSHPSAKARAFHAALAARGIARDFEGAISQWSYPPLAEADRVARLVLARLFPGREVAQP